VRSAVGRGRKGKRSRAGRHAAGSGAQKLARVAVRVAPAVAVIGVLAAAPQVHDLLASTAPGTAGHPGTPHLSTPNPGNPRTVAGEPDENPATFLTSIDRPVVTAAADTRRRKHAVRRSSRAAARPSADPSTPASSPGPQPSASAAGTPTCSGGQTGGMLPENYAAIVNFLTAHGYTGLAAAGIAGNIYQESGGNPESVGDGGGGLIGWTPLPAGYVTGNPAADLQTQLQALLAFNQQWAQFIPALNAATSAAQAADIYVQDFERAGAPAASNREAAAQAVATACGL
jgi:hypothetical protein